MAKGKRKVPDINSSSTADIAFLLLIFFLITTSMDTDRGLARLLPPPPEDEKNENTDKIKERNILQVYLNKDDALMCGNDYIGVDQLRQKAKEFIANIFAYELVCADYLCGFSYFFFRCVKSAVADIIINSAAENKAVLKHYAHL